MSVLGYPRNDALVQKKIDLEVLFGKFRKYIVWYPTVKQFKSGQTTGSIEPIPLLNNIDNAIQLNDLLKKEEMLIIIKPHFAQITDSIKNHKLSNIVFIDDVFFRNNKIASYEFVSSTDALITDYSSIYYDYILCDKPICLIWDDVDQYKINPGLIDGYERFMIGGEKIYDLSDFLKFIKRVSDGVDLLRIERNAVGASFNTSKNGDNTKKVTDFIISRLL